MTLKHIKATSCLPESRLGLLQIAIISAGLCFLMSGETKAQPVPILFSNDTGMSGSQIFVQFLPGGQSTGLFSGVDGYFIDAFGNNQTIQTNTAYSLDQLTAPGEQASRVFVGNFNGRIYMNYGPYGLQNLGANGGGYTPSAADPLDPNYTTRYQYWEQTIAVQPNSSSTIYADLSYIDFTAISMSMYARNNGNLATTNPGSWSINSNVQNGNQTTSNTQVLVNATLGTAANQNLAVLPGGSSPTLPNSDFSRVISPQFSANGTYFDFTNYLGYLDGKSVHISGPFAGTGPQPSSNSTLSSQTYDFTGNFTASSISVPGANASVNATFSNGGIVLNSTSLSGNGTNPQAPGIGDNVAIYISNADLNSQAGIYGNNMPFYVSYNGSAAVYYEALPNDVFGRAVGDLLAGLSFGYVGSNKTFTFNGNNTTIGQLASTQWWANGQGGGNLTMPDGSTVSWEETPAGNSIYFANAVTGNNTYGQPTFFNAYASSLVSPDYLTPAYGFPLQDRLGNNLLVYNTGAALTQNTSLQIVMNPDGAAPLATSLWTGNASNGEWGDASNWAGNAVPGGNSSVQFVGNHTQAYAVDTGANRTVTGIAFNYAAGNFTISNNTITLGGDIVNSSNKTQTINSDLMLSSNATITAAFGDLALGGAIALSNSSTSRTLTFSGTETTTVSGDVSDGLAAGKVVKSGTGELVLSGNNSFSGGLEHREGTVVLGSDSAAGTGNLTLGRAGANSVVLSTGNASRTITNGVTLAGNMTLAPGGSLAASGPVTLQTAMIPQGNSTTPFQTFEISTGADLELSGVIGQNLVGNATAATLVKAGTANLTLSGSASNTFNGTLAVNEGTLFLNKSVGALAYGGSLSIGNGLGAAGSAGVVLVAGNQTNAAGALAMDTDGVLNIGSFSTTVGNMTLSGGSIIGNGTVNVAGNSTVQFVGTGHSSATINSTVEILPTGNSTTTFAVLANQAAQQLVINGPITGNGTLTKSGSGVMAVTTNSSLSGDLYVTGGVLESLSFGNASVSVSNGALSPGGSGSITSIEVKELSSVVGNGTVGSLLMDLGASETSDHIQVTQSGGLTLNGTVLLFKGAGLSGSGSGNFTLVAGASPTVATSSLTFASIDIAGLTGSFVMQGNDLVFLSQYGVTATWNGSSSDWNTGTNWSPNGVPAAGADILFTNQGNASVSTTANQTTGALRFESGAQAFTISDNTITLGGNILNNSSVNQTISSAIALNSSRTIFANTGNISLEGDVALSNVAALPGTLTISGDASTSISGVISDGPASDGSLVKTGNGTLTLTGNNSYTGSTTIAGGTIEANSAYALGQGVLSNKNTLIMDEGTLLATADINSSSNNATFQRIVELRGNGTFNPNGHTISLGEITGPGGLIINDPIGNGTVALYQGSKPNSYLGATGVEGGTLVLNSSNNLGLTSGVSVGVGGSLQLATTMTIGNTPLSLSGAGNAITPGALYVSSGTATWGGTVSLGANATIGVADNMTLNLAATTLSLGNNALTANVGNTAFLNLASAPTGSGGIVKTGNGTLNVIATNGGVFNNSYNGTTTVSGGTLNLQSPAAFGNGTSALAINGGTVSLIAASSTPFSFSTIEIAGTGFNPGSGNLGAINANFSGNTTLASTGNLSLTDDALIYGQSGSLTVAGPVNLGNHTLSIDNRAAEMLFTGPISGIGNLTVAAPGISGIRLTGNNSYSGATTIATGVYLTAANNNALGTSSTTVQSGGSLNLDGNVTVAQNVSLTGTGFGGNGALRNLSGNNTFSGNASLTGSVAFGSANGTLAFASDLANAGGLTFQTDIAAAGITVSGNYTGSGGTTIQGNGTTTITGGASSNYSGTISVISGTFASGNLTGATLTVSPSGNGTAPAYAPGGQGNTQNVHIQGLTLTAGQLLFDLSAMNQSDTITMATPLGGTTSPAFHFSSTSNSTALGNSTFTLLFTQSGAFNPLTPTFTADANLAGLAGTFSLSGSPSNTLIFQTFAGQAVWHGTNGSDWNDNANWNVGVTPGGGSAVVFNSSNSTTVETQTNRLVGGLEFGAGSAALTIGNNTITTYGDIVNNSSATQTISSGLALLQDADVSASTGNLALSGPVALSSGPVGTPGRTLTFTGNQNTLVSGPISNGNATSAAVVKTGNGTVTLQGNHTYTGTTSISAGTFMVNGQTAAGNHFDVEQGGTLGGNGTILGTVAVAGTISPGNSPGTLTTASETWLEDGHYNWQILDGNGTAGTGYDTVAITGTLDLTGLGTGGFAINMWSLSSIGPDVNGHANNFNAANTYAWTLASTTAGIAGFEASDFIVNVAATNGTAGFTNSINGNFSVSVSGNNLLLNYTPVPEPTTCLLLLSSGALLFLNRRRGRKAL
jgi:autotransporter-associated beta strand protein